MNPDNYCFPHESRINVLREHLRTCPPDEIPAARDRLARLSCTALNHLDALRHSGHITLSQYDVYFKILSVIADELDFKRG